RRTDAHARPRAGTRSQPPTGPAVDGRYHAGQPGGDLADQRAADPGDPPDDAARKVVFGLPKGGLKNTESGRLGRPDSFVHKHSAERLCRMGPWFTYRLQRDRIP